MLLSGDLTHMLKRTGSDFTKSGKLVALYEVACPKCNRVRVIKRKDHAKSHINKICKFCSNKNNHPQGEYKEFRISWWKKYELSAQARGLEWKIDINDGLEIFHKQNGLCILTGIPLVTKGNFNEITASLDRIDNSKGYLIDNVQFVHKEINMMRGSLNMNRFFELCELITNSKVKW